MNRIMLSALLLLPTAALAHPGHDGGAPLIAGLTHPVGGVDHLLTMIAVGLWASVVGGKLLWALPATFLCAMLVGGIAGYAGVVMPGVEPMILASVIATGVITAMALRLPTRLSVTMVAVFGFAHGLAHGMEAPGGGIGGFALFGLGFFAATAILHLAGIALGRLAIPAARIAGGLTALGGIFLAFG